MVENIKMPDFSVKPQNPLNTRLVDLIGERFIQKCGQTIREKEETSLTDSTNIESMAGLKYVGLFFSAAWCPPCKHMLQPLKNFYTDVNLQARTLEIILVSSDRNKDEWIHHHQSMPWMSLPWDEVRMSKLREKFEIMGVPALIILDAETGFTVTEKARKDISKDVTQVYESWSKLLELRRAKAVERALMEAIALEQKAEREWKEKMKKEADKLVTEGINVQADVV